MVTMDLSTGAIDRYINTYQTDKLKQIIRMVGTAEWGLVITGDSMLQRACSLNYDTEFIRFLLEHHANVWSVDQVLGNTALHFCCNVERPNIDTIQLLLEANSPIDAQNKRGETPLMHACRLFHWELAEYLLRKGANPNIKNIYDQTVFHIASLSERGRDLIRKFYPSYEFSKPRRELRQFTSRACQTDLERNESVPTTTRKRWSTETFHISHVHGTPRRFSRRILKKRQKRMEEGED